MSKIHAEQVRKARMLAAGLRKNLELIKNRGVRDGQIRELEQMAGEVETTAGEVDGLRLEVSRKVRMTNQKLAVMKGRMTDLKKIVKGNFDPTRWADFGVQDKR